MQCRLLQPTLAATRSAVARRHRALNSRSRARPFSQPKISDMLSQGQDDESSDLGASAAALQA